MTETVIVQKKDPLLSAGAKSLSVSSTWLRVGEMRFDASFYAQNVQSALDILRKSNFDLSKVSDLTKDVFMLPRAKRFFADSSATPFLMPSELFYFQLKPSKYLVAKKLPDLEKWFVKEGWLLMTRSGLPGRPMISTKSLEKFVLSDDILRYVPRNGEESEMNFLYAYFSTWLGKALAVNDQYGVTVDHIEPHHVKDVLVPKLPDSLQSVVSDNIAKVFELREQARSDIDKANKMLLVSLNLQEKAHKLGRINFSIRTSALNGRFDASFHDPRIEQIVQEMKDAGNELHRLGSEQYGAKVFIAPRFKRIYVEDKFGVPFLQGTSIAQIEPYDLKYISRYATERIERWIIRKDWVLVTCSGTIGRVALAPKQWDGWAASQHVLRIITRDSLNKDSELNPGYLATFLSSDYGYYQSLGKIYGAVVDEISEKDTEDILIPSLKKNVQDEIGKLTEEAYELKEKANLIEQATVKILQEIIFNSKKAENGIAALAELKSYSRYADSLVLVGNDKLSLLEGLEEEQRGELEPYDDLRKELGIG